MVLSNTLELGNEQAYLDYFYKNFLPLMEYAYILEKVISTMHFLRQL